MCAAGGVCANTKLRAMLEEEGRRKGVRICMPPLSLTGDNAAMIASQGYYEFLAGHRAGWELNAVASLPSDKGSPAELNV